MANSTDRGKVRTMRWQTFDRIDRIGLDLVLGALWVASAVTLVGGPVRRWIAGDPVVVDVDARAAGLESAADGARVPLEVAGADTVVRLVGLVPPVLAVVALGIGVVLLASVVSRITKSDAFRRSNITRLRLLAGLLIAAPFVVAYAELGASAVAMARLDLPGGAAGTTLPLWGFVAGLATAAVAQAFAAGASLREDTDGLV